MAGRPLKFATKEKLEEAIQAYFDEVALDFFKDTNGVIHQAPLTITGLALALATSRKVLMEYEERDEFSNTVKRAKTVVENYAEKRLFGNNATGAIFALKNFGWKDKQEREYSGDPNSPIEIRTKIEISTEDQQLIEEMKKRNQ